MKALIQRVSHARVTVGDVVTGEIGAGLLVFLCVQKGDTDGDLDYIVRKVPNLRIFEDPEGKMNLSVRDFGGGVLLVSQFTLAADCRKGTRPSFDQAELPHGAKEMFEKAVERFRSEGIPTATGQFAAPMKVSLVNDGPVTIFLDSRK